MLNDEIADQVFVQTHPSNGCPANESAFASTIPGCSYQDHVFALEIIHDWKVASASDSFDDTMAPETFSLYPQALFSTVFEIHHGSEVCRRRLIDFLYSTVANAAEWTQGERAHWFSVPTIKPPCLGLGFTLSSSFVLRDMCSSILRSFTSAQRRLEASSSAFTTCGKTALPRLEFIESGTTSQSTSNISNCYPALSFATNVTLDSSVLTKSWRSSSLVKRMILFSKTSARRILNVDIGADKRGGVTRGDKRRGGLNIMASDGDDSRDLGHLSGWQVAMALVGSLDFMAGRVEICIPRKLRWYFR